MSRSLRCLTVVLLSLSLGVHWSLVQGVAWVTMFAGHVRTASVPEALARTFDGEHPCRICHVVREGRSAEKKGPEQQVLKKLEPVPLNHGAVIRFVVARPLPIGRREPVWVGRTELPALPPPRVT